MTEKVDPWAYYKAAMKGERIKVTTAQAGYFRMKHHQPLQNGSLWEPVGFWWVTHPRLDTPFLRWQRYAEPHASKPWDHIFEDQVNDLFARCSSYPIPVDLYKAVRAGGKWPPVYEVELPLEWARLGKLMTVPAAESLLRSKTAVSSTRAAVQELATAPEPRQFPPEGEAGEPGIGHNSEAEDTRTRDQKFRDLFNEHVRDYTKWLKGIGGVIKTQEQSDEANDWKVKFQTLSTQGEKVRKVEKQPHLDAGRAVDEAWNPTIKACDKQFDEVVKAVGVFLTAERKRQAEQRASEERQLAAQQKAAAETGALVPEPSPRAADPEPIRSGVVGRRTEIKQVPYVVIDDNEAMFAAYIQTDECAMAAITWAERVRVQPQEPVPGTRIAYRDEVKG